MRQCPMHLLYFISIAKPRSNTILEPTSTEPCQLRFCFQRNNDSLWRLSKYIYWLRTERTNHSATPLLYLRKMYVTNYMYC